ncbi:MAG TPA: hypothetical protein VGO00_24200 [Kofleriaceae bacterium]|nr:hypothetical protein [Kofleriaceae bacterium]
MKLVVIASMLAGCASFEDPNIVSDLRVLAMSATVPEQILDVDLTNPPPPETLLAMLQPSMVCALVGDPGNARRLRWSMTVCPETDTDRCDDGDPQMVIGSGLADDPDLSGFDFTQPANCLVNGAVATECMCGLVQPDSNLLDVLMTSLADDSLAGFQGLDYAVVLRVGGENADPSLDQYAQKALRVAARVPANRQPNSNPSIKQMQSTLPGETAHTIGIGRCVDPAVNGDRLIVAPGTKVNLFPAEPDGAREMYVIPTLDGGSEVFTESLTYQWMANGGGISRGDTGGPKDAFGNDAPLDTDWTAPSAKDVTEPTDFTVWMIQRDERLGANWLELCIHVNPS